jgi:hypothetical protein
MHKHSFNVTISINLFCIWYVWAIVSIILNSIKIFINVVIAGIPNQISERILETSTCRLQRNNNSRISIALKHVWCLLTVVTHISNLVKV